MASDPYQVLGVSKQASEEEIRRAYRRLAKECHPDLHPGDSAAADRFKRLSAAYDIVGDTAKRRLYDLGEIDASGEPRRQYARQHAGPGRHRAGGFARGGHEFEGLGDVFSDFFGDGGRFGTGRGGVRGRGQDVRYTLEVDFLEAINGAKKRVSLPDGGVLDLTVPEGVADGQVLRLKGKGGAGIGGGETGDALVEIKVRPHADFRRVGDDILLEVPITLDEAVLGARIEVPTTTGRVQLTVPKATSSGKVLRLKGKGARNAARGTSGDQLVTLRIVLPEKVDDGLAYFIAEWRKKHPYDPGRR
jgi:DnaJ-class molecular chaperone